MIMTKRVQNKQMNIQVRDTSTAPTR